MATAASFSLLPFFSLLFSLLLCPVLLVWREVQVNLQEDPKPTSGLMLCYF